MKWRANEFGTPDTRWCEVETEGGVTVFATDVRDLHPTCDAEYAEDIKHVTLGAAAPDLLEACEGLLIYREGSASYEAAEAKARAAIAKARGES